jgi:hypothetical protein
MEKSTRDKIIELMLQMLGGDSKHAKLIHDVKTVYTPLEILMPIRHEYKEAVDRLRAVLAKGDEIKSTHKVAISDHSAKVMVEIGDTMHACLEHCAELIAADIARRDTPVATPKKDKS